MKWVIGLLPKKVLINFVFDVLKRWVKDTDNGLDDVLVEFVECAYKNEWDKCGELLPVIGSEVKELIRKQRSK